MTQQSFDAFFLLQDLTHFLRDHAQLFCRQVVKLKDIPPVEISIPIQGSVVYISLLLVVFHTQHPSKNMAMLNSDKLLVRETSRW